jgi:hypothetical protein
MKKNCNGTIGIQPLRHLDERLKRVAANRGTTFRYCPKFRYTLEDNGTDFRNIDLSG